MTSASVDARVRAMDETDVLGPVDYVVVEFPADKANFKGEIADELVSLIDRELVRVLDLVILHKKDDGTVEVDELDEVAEESVGSLAKLEGELGLLLAAEDIEHLSAAIEPGSIAGVLVWENRWAGPFGAAVRRAGGQLVASGRIPTQALLAAVDAQSGSEGD
jgi:Family of unknown function (DUF6325)